MTEHTPGPWKKCGGGTPRYTAVHSAKGYIVFQMADRVMDKERGEPLPAPDYHEQQANARLIAAAPDLLAACEASLKMFDHTIGRPLVTDEQKLLKAAIAKAKGGAA